MGRAGPDEFAAMKLSPSMASFKVLVLKFVIDYITANKVSPSQGEIERGLDSTRSRVRDALRSLLKEGLLLRRPGERGLALPSQEGDALRLLLGLGWKAKEGVLQAPSRYRPVSTVPYDLDYP